MMSGDTRNTTFAFNKTVSGHRHLSKESLCEDYSELYIDPKYKFYICAVADGHGDNKCFRSNVGSELACKIAIENLISFAEKFNYQKIKSNEECKTIIRRLTDSIIGKWNDAVSEYHSNHPITPSEWKMLLAKFSDRTIEDTIDSEKHISHIYGTTLMAALQTEEYLLLIKQGDGRIDVFYEDGSVDQPVEWDDRCQFNETTSLCDLDAPSSIKHRLFNLNDVKIKACFLETDGVEDSFRDSIDDGSKGTLMRGVHTFNKYLLCNISEMNQEELDGFLDQLLSALSSNGLFGQPGSGDDISVAGIVNRDFCGYYSKVYEKEIRHYELSEKLAKKESDLLGKTRKHDVLKKKSEDADKSVLELEEKLKQINEKIETVGEQYYKTQNSFDTSKTEVIDYDLVIEPDTIELGTNTDSDNHITQKTDDVKRLEKELDRLQREENDIKIKIEEAMVLQKSAKQNFSDYDESFQSIYKECEQIKEELKKLE